MSLLWNQVRIWSVSTLLAVAVPASATEPAEPLAGLLGNTMVGTGPRGTDRYVLRADHSYLARFSDGGISRGFWRTTATQMCFFTVNADSDGKAGCFALSGQERVGGSWTVEGDRLTVEPGVNPADARQDFDTLTGGPDDPMGPHYGKVLVRTQGGKTTMLRLNRDLTYTLAVGDTVQESGGWHISKRGLCLFRTVPRGDGEKPVPCIAKPAELTRGKWTRGDATYRFES